MRIAKPSAFALCALLTAAFAPAALAQQQEQDKTYPPQASVAVKRPFTTVPAALPAVKSAPDARALDQARKQVGKTGAFQGTVTQVYSPRGHDVVILDFAPDYHAALTAVVRPEAYANFPDLAGLRGKHVLIQGKVIAFHGSPEVEMTSPAQVKVITGK